tara:strand:+ start:261 stop:1652 length:1392 start_codon:yes stop_codon:yes gene_type:complete
MSNPDKKLINLLKKFPDQNPNPVIRISEDGVLEYFNNPSKKIIEYYGFKLKNKISDIFLHHLKETQSKGEHSFEIRLKTSSFFFKAVYTKELKSINIYGTDITAKKVIDKFPDSNPNPVMKIDLNGNLSYFNKSSTYIIKQLKIDLNAQIPEQILDKIFNGKEVFELTIGSKVYLFNIVLINEFNFFLIYGTDITDTKDKENILQKLSKYFSPQVYSSIFSGKLDVTINTSRKDLTVFFSDIKSFTTITEKLEPEVLTNLITNYLTAMTDIAIKYGGTVDKYIGDAIMIFFGDPNSNGIKNDAIACVSMAIEMKKALKSLRKEWKSSGLSESLNVRMGIHTDVCTVGNFGSLDRLDYTVLGNGVNLASRLESSANSNEILISENTYNLIKNKIQCNYFDEIKVKGKAHSIKTFQVIRKKNKKKEETIINASKEGVKLSINKKKIKNLDEVISLLEDSIEKLTN